MSLDQLRDVQEKITGMEARLVRLEKSLIMLIRIAASLNQQDSNVINVAFAMDREDYADAKEKLEKLQTEGDDLMKQLQDVIDEQK